MSENEFWVNTWKVIASGVAMVTMTIAVASTIQTSMQTSAKVTIARAEAEKAAHEEAAKMWEHMPWGAR